MTAPARQHGEHDPEWFARPDGPEGGAGLRFGCTMCGNCCSGPPGYVLVSDRECEALAARLGISTESFKRDYTNMMDEGRSLNERRTPAGFDCVFLDRQKMPGKAVCSVYEHRPAQCRTWPFWPSLLESRAAWTRAKKTCPGLDRGALVPVQQIRVLRDTISI